MKSDKKFGIRSIIILSTLSSVLVTSSLLIWSYFKMVIPQDAVGILILITIGANAICIACILFLTRPVISAIEQVCEESKRIASGQFSVRIHSNGPREAREMAEHFNEMAAQLDTLFSQVQQQEKIRQELIANLSHDLKTPIASIRSFSDALLDQVVEGEVAKQYLKTIQVESIELAQLIDELMILSDVDRVQVKHEEQFLFVDQMMVDLLETFRFDFKKKHVEVSLTIDSKIPNKRIIPEKIRRVMTNLIKNALEFTPEYGEINCIIQYENKSLCFTVQDTGIGIPVDQQEKIFDRFYRVEKSRNRKYGGHGLGLAICKGIVSLYDGEIGVKSQLGFGSEFWFTIPAQSLGFQESDTSQKENQ